MSQLFRVVCHDTLSIRTAPRLNAPKLSTAVLVYGDILPVRPGSRTEAMNFEWWEHANNPGWWSATRQLHPEHILMEPYALPHGPVEADTVLFEVVTDTVNVRRLPRLGDTLVPGQMLKRRDLRRFRNPTPADGFLWWEHDDHPGWWSASGSLQGGLVFMSRIDDTIPEEERVRLAVPWITQIQSPVNLANDCGHACVLMVLRYHGSAQETTVEQLYALPHKNTSGTTSLTHLKHLAEDAPKKDAEPRIELTTFHRDDATAENFQLLKAQLKDDRPVILLVWYPSLKFTNPSSGDFCHWVVVTGFSGETIYINDPLWATENAGAGLPIDQATLLTACADTDEGLCAAYRAT